jgi:hypothetical protein
MYGLERGDTDWGGKARHFLKALGFVRIVDNLEESMWTLAPKDSDFVVLVALYSDDFILGGPKRATIEAHNSLNKALGFSPSPNYVMEEIIGIQRHCYRDEEGRRCVMLHQAAYCRFIVKQFVDRHNHGNPLRRVAAPGFARETRGKECSDGVEKEEEFEVPSYVPKLGHEAAEWGGKGLWLARGTRLDIAVGVQKLMERITKWTRLEDYYLWRLLCYLHTFPALGIVYVVDVDELPQVILNLRTDADLGSDTVVARSTAGFHISVRGPVVTRALFDWTARRLGATSRGTPDAETASLDEATFACALPHLDLFETLFKRAIRLIAEGDNETSIAAIRKGYSRRLAYLRRHQRTSISALNEVYFGGDNDPLLDALDHKCLNRLVHIAGTENTADILTKLLEAATHWYLLEKLGMLPVPPEAEKQ